MYYCRLFTEIIQEKVGLDKLNHLFILRYGKEKKILEKLQSRIIQYFMLMLCFIYSKYYQR